MTDPQQVLIESDTQCRLYSRVLIGLHALPNERAAGAQHIIGQVHCSAGSSRARSAAMRSAYACAHAANASEDAWSIAGRRNDSFSAGRGDIRRARGCDLGGQRAEVAVFRRAVDQAVKVSPVRVFVGHVHVSDEKPGLINLSQSHRPVGWSAHKMRGSRLVAAVLL